MSDDQDRVAHLLACEREAHAAVPAPTRPVTVPDHETEVMAAHQGTVLPPTFSVSDEAIA
jgi:hypothetical protein